MAEHRVRPSFAKVSREDSVRFFGAGQGEAERRKEAEWEQIGAGMVCGRGDGELAVMGWYSRVMWNVYMMAFERRVAEVVGVE